MVVLSEGLRSALVVAGVVLVAQSSPTLCNPMDSSPPGTSVPRILLARILEWAAISFSRGVSWPKDRTQVSCIVGRLFIIWATREAPDKLQMQWNFNSSSSSEYSELSCCRRLGPIYGYYTYPYNIVPVSWWCIILDAFTCECRKTLKRDQFAAEAVMQLLRSSECA